MEVGSSSLPGTTDRARETSSMYPRHNLPGTTRQRDNETKSQRDKKSKIQSEAKTTPGGLAQLARAPALQAGGQRFESVILHVAILIMI